QDCAGCFPRTRRKWRARCCGLRKPRRPGCACQHSQPREATAVLRRGSEASGANNNPITAAYRGGAHQPGSRAISDQATNRTTPAVLSQREALRATPTILDSSDTLGPAAKAWWSPAEFMHEGCTPKLPDWSPIE